MLLGRTYQRSEEKQSCSTRNGSLLNWLRGGRVIFVTIVKQKAYYKFEAILGGTVQLFGDQVSK